MTPRGKLIIIGGAIDKGSFTEKNFEADVSKNLNFFEKGILRRIINESLYAKESRIEIIPTASQVPESVGEEYKRAFQYLGADNVGTLNILTREDARSTDICERLLRADVVMFTGGDQLRLSTIIGGTEAHEILLEKYQNSAFIIAGTSAGAAAASVNMIYQGSASEALLKGEVKITGGLGFIDSMIVDTHFVKRGRIGRLFQAVVSNPRLLGVGLGEDTGLLIIDGQEVEAIGSGLVILVDGREIRNTNITDIRMGDPISIDNLIVHVLSQGDRFHLKSRKMEMRKHEAEEIE